MSVQQATGFTMCTVKAGLAAGTTTTFSTTGATLYCIDGKAYSVAAKTNAATPTIDASTGKAFKAIEPGKGSLFLFGYSAAGDVKVIQGTIGSDSEPYEYKGSATDFCPFAELIVKVASNAGASWTFGVNNQAGVTGVTYVRNDLMTVMSRAHNS